MRRVMNITRLQSGVDRLRDARTQDVGRLITYGQGHCHGLSSTTAAVLLPFAKVLGLFVKYRAGSVMRRDGGRCGAACLCVPSLCVALIVFLLVCVPGVCAG
jgi:hypothetical protein